MPSLTVENYCKAVWQLGSKTPDGWVATGQLAGLLNVAPGTVTSMLKTLAETELAEYRPYAGVRLSDTGRTLALRVLRRHRLVEQFLVQTLGFRWDEVHAEAENLEHAFSDVVIDRIDSFLGFPRFDPHGDPIPTAEGCLPGSSSCTPLTASRLGQTVRIVRVLNQDAEFLRFLTAAGLHLGTDLQIVSHNDKSMTAHHDGQQTELERSVAQQILVETVARPLSERRGEESD